MRNITISTPYLPLGRYMDMNHLRNVFIDGYEYA